MDGRKDALNDAALEQEIEALLAVEPSRDFVTRVRSRVAEESMSSGLRWRWPLAAVATAMALVLLGIALWRPVEQGERSASHPTQGATRQVPAAPVVTRQGESVPVALVPREPAIAAPLRRAIDVALPPVIIAENETRAFAMLVRTAPTTQFDFVAAAATDMAPLEVDKMPAIDLIEIKPLVKAVELE